MCVSLRVYMAVCINENKCSTWSSVNCATPPPLAKHTHTLSANELVERLICGIHTRINATRQLVERRLLVRLTDGSYAPRTTHQLSGHTLSSLSHSHALAPSLPRALAPRQSLRACAHKTTYKGCSTFACPSSLCY